MDRFRARLLAELAPRRLAPAVIAGLVTGLLAVIVGISLAALIFAGELAPFLTAGVGLALVSGAILAAVVALTSSYPGTIAVIQDSPAVVLAAMVASIAAAMEGHVPEDIFVMAAVAIAATTILTGVFLLALGVLRLGDLIRYIPYPVVGGFLAGAGWLLVKGGVGVVAEVTPGLGGLARLFSAELAPRWLPALAFAAALLALVRRVRHFLVIPAALLGAIALFYAVLWASGGSLASARAQGWLLGPFPDGALWQPPTLAAIAGVDVWRLVGEAGNAATIVLVSVVSLLLNASGLEVTVQRDVDLNRELRSAGLANLIAGAVGGPLGFHSLSLSALGYRMGATSRIVGLTAAAVCVAMLIFGAPILSLFPKPVLGGLLIFLGLGFLVEWLYDAWWRLPRSDYLVVASILLVIDLVGVLEGAAFGVLVAVILFVINYSRIDVVKHALSRAVFTSRVERTRAQQRLLREFGEEIYILELQGLIFFGTANELLARARRRLDDGKLPAPRFIVLDFRRASGLDASAALSFIKLRQLAQARRIRLVFTGLSPAINEILAAEVLSDEDRQTWKVFGDLDHGIEWSEDQLLEVHGGELAAFRTRGAEAPAAVAPAGAGEASFFTRFAAATGEPSLLGDPAADRRLAGYLERMEVQAGDRLIRQGEAPRALYFIVSGGATAILELGEGRTARLRKMGPGTIVGEVGLYRGTRTTASVVIDEPGVVYALPAASLREMEARDPEGAAAFHRFIAELLAERLSGATGTIEALLR